MVKKSYVPPELIAVPLPPSSQGEERGTVPSIDYLS